MDLGELAAREAAVEQRVQLSDAGRERPPPLLAPQRRLVGLEAPRPQQVLEGALPLDQGRRERGDGERERAALMLSLFLRLNDRPRAAAVNPEDLGVVLPPTPILDGSQLMRKTGTSSTSPGSSASFVAAEASRL